MEDAAVSDAGAASPPPAPPAPVSVGGAGRSRRSFPSAEPAWLSRRLRIASNSRVRKVLPFTPLAQIPTGEAPLRPKQLLAPGFTRDRAKPVCELRGGDTERAPRT